MWRLQGFLLPLPGKPPHYLSDYCCCWSDTRSNAWWQARSPSINPAQLPDSFRSITSTLFWLIIACVNCNLNNNSQSHVILQDDQHQGSFLYMEATDRGHLPPAIAPLKRCILHSSVVAVSSGLLHMVRNSHWIRRDKTGEIDNKQLPGNNSECPRMYFFKKMVQYKPWLAYHI